MQTVIAILIILICLLGMIGAIYLFVRVCIISNKITKEKSLNLHNPKIDGLDEICKITVPQSIITFYNTFKFIDQNNITLHDPQTNRRWTVGEFYSINKTITKELMYIHGIDIGLPIANDGSKGYYYLNKNLQLILNDCGKELLVAKTLEEFSAMLQIETNEE